MRPIPAILAVAAGALTLISAVPASAAPGVALLSSQDGQTRTINDPQPRQCHRGFGPNSGLANYTEGTILVFPDSNCRTRIFDPVEPGDTKNGNIGSFFALD
ncbi:hypothetical protein ACFFV7_41545 [Nonomuraea spiralis]|uniref:Secreted protein n=1 Tax=Nonomuraea spiralis TaxID=46182 RepID=A0ABV5IUZ3_9ACTN|nr:hypothetical protein [Nonomuraea spiralis]GGT16628.1 hypothetical protein GCM10010176_071430 [Nonomuraea spiralis]